MKSGNFTTRAHWAAAAFLLLTFPCALVANAQEDMKGMPGMPAASPSPSAQPEPSPAKSPPPKLPAAESMEGMPGMTPAPAVTGKRAGSLDSSPTKMKDMSGMAKPPAGRKAPMAAMPGMDASPAAPKGGMSAMPGMGPGEKGTAQRQSVPGVTLLGPPQKWVPPKGEDRSAELLPAAELDQHLKTLPPPVEDSKIHRFFLFDLLEYRASHSGPAALNWDFVGWVGGDYHRLWIKSEGEVTLSRGSEAQGDLQLLYGRLIAPNWDLQLGARVKAIAGPDRSRSARAYAVVALQGIAPGNFGVEPSLYLSDRGEVSAQLTLSADLRLTQRLVLQPRAEIQASVQGDRRFSTRPGLNATDLGLRLRYEIRREFAPYIGVSWVRKYGGTAALSRAEGESANSVAFVAGLRLAF